MTKLEVFLSLVIVFENVILCAHWWLTKQDKLEQRDLDDYQDRWDKQWVRNKKECGDNK